MKDLTTAHWAPPRHDPLNLTERIPILACHLDALIERGPHADIWWCFGARQWQSLADALAPHRVPRPRPGPPGRRGSGRHQAREERLEATHCPACHRREDAFTSQRTASDGTKPCWDCREKAKEAAREKKQQAVRDAHALAEEIQFSTTGC